MTFMLCLFLLCKMMYKKYFTKDVSRMMQTRMDSKKIFPYSCCEVNIFQTSWLLKAARTWPSGTTWTHRNGWLSSTSRVTSWTLLETRERRKSSFKRVNTRDQCYKTFLPLLSYGKYFIYLRHLHTFKWTALNMELYSWKIWWLVYTQLSNQLGTINCHALVSGNFSGLCKLILHLMGILGTYYTLSSGNKSFRILVPAFVRTGRRPYRIWNGRWRWRLWSGGRFPGLSILTLSVTRW